MAEHLKDDTFHKGSLHGLLFNGQRLTEEQLRILEREAEEKQDAQLKRHVAVARALNQIP